jgi:HD-GYP domain-containing protein (c-di-GMP phosphodiesterase class II)
LRTLRDQPIENREVRRLLEELGRAAESFYDERGRLEIQALRQSIFVNRLEIQRDIENYVAFGHVLGTLQRAGVGTLRVEDAPSRREWHVFLRELIRHSARHDRPDGVLPLQRSLASRGVVRISASPNLMEESLLSDEVEKRKAARRTWERSVAVSKELFTGTRMGRSTNVKEIRHAVIGIVDQVLNNEASLGGLSTLKDYDDYSFTHSVNVCIFCVAIGRRLGLSKRQLYDLGLAALVHDIGMSRIPVGILTKSTRLTPEEQAAMQAHTWLGALSVFNLREFGKTPYQSMIAAYEHHLKPDGSGYPRIKRPRQPSVFSKIIAVAAAFDAATNTRSYSAATPPDEVLKELWENEDLGFDPVIVKALINLLGVYPVGTCVILDTFELALVHTANPDPTFVHRPVVRVLSDPNGLWLEPPPLADLADTDGDGNFLRTIIKVTDPEKYGVSVSAYFT